MTEIQAVALTESGLNKLVMSMYDVQHMRILIENRFRGTDNNELIEFVKGMNGLETGVKELIESETKTYPIHEWIIAQKGLSYGIAGQLIGLLHPISRFDNIGKMWAYSGMGVMDVCDTCDKRWFDTDLKAKKIINIADRLEEQANKRKDQKKESREFYLKKAKNMMCSCDKPILKKRAQGKATGFLSDYNPTMKMLCYKIGVQFVKQGGLYRKLYDEFREEYEVREDLKAEAAGKSGKAMIKNGKEVKVKGTAHIHNMAQRKAVKIFLSHLWAEWRELEGLSVTKPYVIDMMGHSKYIAPENTTKEN